jgi:hypothetical protein
MARQQFWSPYMTVSVAAGSPVPSWRNLNKRDEPFLILSSSCQSYHFHHWLFVAFSGESFPCKGRATRSIPRTAGYFTQNCNSSLPQIVSIWVFRKILGEISWLMPLEVAPDLPARKRTQNSTKSMTTGNEGTPVDLIRKDSKKSGSKI